MCRKYQTFGVAALALGAGFILSALFSSVVLSVIIGLILIVTGCILTKKI